MKPASSYFLVRIDKTAQQEKRSFLKPSVCAYLGIDSKPGSNTLPGILITAVHSGSPAAEAMLQPGDRIISVATGDFSQPIIPESFAQFTEVITSLAPGTVIRLKYISTFSSSDKYTGAWKDIPLGKKEVKLHLSQVKEMEYNLQYGIITAAGKEATESFPEAQIGDVLIFNHKVEYKPYTEGDTLHNDHHLLETLPGGDEHRIVNSQYEVFGVLKLYKARQPEIIPHPFWVFCHHQFRKSSFQMTGGIWLPDHWEMKMQDMIAKLEELKNQVTDVTAFSTIGQKTSEKNYRQQEADKKRLEELNRERAALTKKMHQKKLVDATVLYVNPRSIEDTGIALKRGDNILYDYQMLYPLEILDTYYVLARTKYIEAITY